MTHWEPDAILYINLKNRPDRNEHFLNEIKKFCKNDNKIIRIDAIEHFIGALGCTKSHIIAMELFETNSSWNSVVIFEDDFTFIDDSLEENNKKIKHVIDNNSNWDIINLSGICYKTLNIPNEEIYRKVFELSTTSSYVLNRKFLPTLLQNFRESAQILEKNLLLYSQTIKENPNLFREYIFDYWCDNYWKRLQPSHEWFVIYPTLGYQMESVSNNNRLLLESNEI